jgi:phosphopantothenoylcysteine synthetase/decarboxylase
MNILITAGNTLVLIDRVRAITNVFSGRTGAAIAQHAAQRGHQTTLLTSHPDAVEPAKLLTVCPYRTFDELESLLREVVCSSRHEAVIHSAAVSDYKAAGIYAPDEATRYSEVDHSWRRDDPGPPRLSSRAAGKIKSDAPELWLRLVRTPKLIDRIRTEWEFRGILVKFKLEVGLDEKALIEVAERSRLQSDADLMVANTLDDMHAWAFLGSRSGKYERIERALLPDRLLDDVESLNEARQHA